MFNREAAGRRKNKRKVFKEDGGYVYTGRLLYIQDGGCEEGKYEDKQVINCKIEIILCI